jgi:hypothetical protein
MADAPDLDRIARLLVHEIDLIASDLDAREAAALFREQLRLVWNARGAADLVALETSLTSQMGAIAAGPYLKNLDRALRALDKQPVTKKTAGAS